VIVKARQQIYKKLPKILEKLIAAADEGDRQAATFLASKVMPDIRPTEAPNDFVLPADAPEAAVADAVLTGTITPQQASAWLRIRMLEHVKTTGGTMTHAEFVHWLQQEVSFDPPISNPEHNNP
jgi:hypothetical protein